MTSVFLEGGGQMWLCGRTALPADSSSDTSEDGQEGATGGQRITISPRASRHTDSVWKRTAYINKDVYFQQRRTLIFYRRSSPPHLRASEPFVHCACSNIGTTEPSKDDNVSNDPSRPEQLPFPLLAFFVSCLTLPSNPLHLPARLIAC